MADTSIEWATKVWNPVRGCSIVSKGCTNCYAMKQAHRFAGPGGKYEGLTQMSRGGPVWTGEVRAHPSQLEIPLHWRKPQRVFVNSMSDLFHEDVPDSFIDQVFAVMALCPQHTFQVLTKRPERMRQYMTAASTGKRSLINSTGAEFFKRIVTDDLIAAIKASFPNVWLGVSVEDQATADERIPLLLETPAALRWVSYEPALGLVDFERVCVRGGATLSTVSDALRGHKWDESAYTGGAPPLKSDPPDGARLDWIVVGGESGPGARPFDIGWARSTVEQCKGAGVACFVKQLGARVNWDGCAGPDEHWPTGTKKVDHGNGGWRIMLRDRKGGDMEEWPADLRVREWPEVRS